MRLNGRQTIYQMIQLADEVTQRGGTPLEPLAYKHRYHDRLMAAHPGPARRPWSRGGDAGGVDGARQSRAAGGAAARAG